MSNRYLIMIATLCVLGAAPTSRAEADSFFTTFQTDTLHGGLFPLFPMGLGVLTEVDVSADLSAHQPFRNDSGVVQAGTWGATVGLEAEGVGDVGDVSETGSYSVDPGDLFFLDVGGSSEKVLTTALDSFDASPGVSGVEVLAELQIDSLTGLDEADRAFGGADGLVTYFYTPFPEPSSFVLLATGLLGLAVARTRSARNRQ